MLDQIINCPFFWFLEAMIDRLSVIIVLILFFRIRRKQKETVESEKCILNSFLVKLEDIITKIKN